MRSKAWRSRKHVAAASSPAASYRQVAALTSPARYTVAAAPGLLAHASVTEVVQFCPMGPKLRYTAVSIGNPAQGVCVTHLELLLRTVFALPNASIKGLLSRIRVEISSPAENKRGESIPGYKRQRCWEISRRNERPRRNVHQHVADFSAQAWSWLCVYETVFREQHANNKQKATEIGQFMRMLTFSG
jgi:hypothetical protein